VGERGGGDVCVRKRESDARPRMRARRKKGRVEGKQGRGARRGGLGEAQAGAGVPLLLLSIFTPRPFRPHPPPEAGPRSCHSRHGHMAGHTPVGGRGAGGGRRARSGAKTEEGIYAPRGSAVFFCEDGKKTLPALTARTHTGAPAPRTHARRRAARCPHALSAGDPGDEGARALCAGRISPGRSNEKTSKARAGSFACVSVFLLCSLPHARRRRGQGAPAHHLTPHTHGWPRQH
jgi:hypothetical protein